MSGFKECPSWRSLSLLKVFKQHQTMSACCRKMFLSYLVGTVGSIGYCFYLIWLVAYLENDRYYWFFAIIPTCLLILLIGDHVISRDSHAIFNASFAVLLVVICTFTMLTRQAYYHLSTDVFIGPQLVIVSLKGSIVFFISGFLVERECRLKRILEDKDILSRALLDFVDVFNLVELLSLNKCVGNGSSVTEGSSLEIAIQAFCTMSLAILCYNDDIFHLFADSDDTVDCFQSMIVNVIYLASPIYQNMPFLVIRIIVWTRHGVFSLVFMVKNIWAIVVCFAEISKMFEETDELNKKPSHNVNTLRVV